MTTRVVIVNADSVERLLEEIRERIEGKLSDIIRGCNELYARALSAEYDVRRIRDALSKNRGRFIRVKKVATFYEKWLRMDFSRSLLKSYRAIQKVNSVVNRK